MPSSDHSSDRRPDPDALLAHPELRGQGRLKVFLGAAPGVGKTYAMLQGARRLVGEGREVVIGLVETHGRADTAALLDGLEILLRRTVLYRGRSLEEFDLDAALARRPQLIVVDELAHTNAPESRHPKRWQDVDELLQAGIDVWTALNIQHLESLADVVSRVTGIVVRETVPDRVLQTAADVVLVDITPDELIARLKEGKVYLPQTARRATENFFTLRNLTALRELALRRTADRVDDQMVDYLRQNAIEGPWQTSERLLACIGADPLSEHVVRTASRLATGLNAPWTAVHIEGAGHEEADPVKLERIDRSLQLAKSLGAEIERLAGSDVTDVLLRYARRENISQIIVGRSRAGFFARLVGRSLPAEIIRRSVDIGVHVVNAPDVQAPPVKMPRVSLPWRRGLPGVIAAVVAVAAAVVIGIGLDSALELPNLSMVFLLAVLACAGTYGLFSAVAASFLSALAYNFFFIEPVYTFTVTEPQELLSLLVFLVVAVLTGSLAGRVRDQSKAMRARAQSIQSLYDFSQRLSGAARLDDVLWAATAHLQKARGGRIVFLLPDDGVLHLRSAWPPDIELTAGEASASRWAYEKSEPAGWRTGTLPNVAFQFRPLVTPRGALGVCGFEPRHADEAMSPEDERAVSAILDQTAIAIDRSLLIGEAVKAAALADNERLRSTLLSSLSHDLRTPLASITGAVTTLRQFGPGLSDAERQDLMASIEEEAARLSRFVANLLDMSRIESGAMKVRQDFVDLADVVRTAVERSRKAFPDQKVEMSVARDLPFIRGDADLLEQVLFNLLDNAHKYSGDTGAIVHARREGDEIMLSVTDEGVGIKPADLDLIFEKFYRGGRADGRKAGTGLGLSIARGLVEAMGGSIAAQSPAVRRRGTRIVLRFPVADPAGGKAA